jgi:predicted kinase
MLDNFDYLEENGRAEAVGRLKSWTRQSLDDARAVMIRRYESGFVRECHGDLHLKNLVRLSSGIVPYDCVEFSVELRSIDVISDISFLFMDLVSRDERRLAWRFMNRYLECTGDYAGVSVLRLYTVYHALIRAKIAAIRSIERVRDTRRQEDREESAHYCDVALRLIEAPAPRLVVMHGFSGSGKTWLSGQLMLQLPAIRLRSDIERKRVHGLGETQGSGSAVAEGLYAPEARAGIYARLAELAESILHAGHNVVVDASFLARAERDRFRDLANKAGSDFSIVSASASQEELVGRLERRQRDDTEPSEADVEVLRYQLDHADALDSDERDRVVEVATDRRVDIDNMIRKSTGS